MTVVVVYYSWIAVATTTPILMTLINWIIRLFRSLAQSWDSLDVFLVAVLAENAAVSLGNFLWSLLVLLKPEAKEICDFVTWAFVTSRLLYMMTLVSMVAEKSLRFGSPCKFKKNQIRYHVVVITLLSLFVGLALVFAHRSEQTFSAETCSFLPYEADFKFSLFFVVLQCVLVLLLLTCVAYSRFKKNRFEPYATSEAKYGLKPDLIGLFVSNSSANSTTTKNSTLTSKERKIHLSFHPFDGRLFARRFKLVLALCFVSYGINHFPFLILNIMGTFFREYLPKWSFQNITIWLSICDGFVTSLCILSFDVNIQELIHKLFFNTENWDTNEKNRNFCFPSMSDVKFPLTNGSLLSGSKPTLGIRGTQFLSNKRGLHHHLFAKQVRGILTPAPIRSLSRDIAPMYETHLHAQTKNFQVPPSYQCLRSSSSEALSQQTYSTLCKSTKCLSSDQCTKCFPDHEYSCCTTDANDDFEFHFGTEFRRKSENDVDAEMIRHDVALQQNKNSLSNQSEIFFNDKRLDCKPVGSNNRTASMNDLDIFENKSYPLPFGKSGNNVNPSEPSKLLTKPDYSKCYSCCNSPVLKTLTSFSNDRLDVKQIPLFSPIFDNFPRTNTNSSKEGTSAYQCGENGTVNFSFTKSLQL